MQTKGCSAPQLRISAAPQGAHCKVRMQQHRQEKAKNKGNQT